MKKLDDIRSGYKGAWSVSNFSGHANSQSITANEIACRAAREILVRDLSGEGDFYARSYTN